MTEQERQRINPYPARPAIPSAPVGPYGPSLWAPTEPLPVPAQPVAPVVPVAQNPAEQRQIGRAEGAAVQAARDSWWDRTVATARRNGLALGCLGGLALGCLCASCAVASQLISLRVGLPRITIGTTGNTLGGTTSGGSEFACSPATDMGGFFNTTITVDTTGKGGAVLDVTQSGGPTDVTVIPPGVDVQVSGDIHEWVYNTDCTPAQITQQAKDHADQAGDVYVPDFRSVPGIDSASAIINNNVATLRLMDAAVAPTRKRVGARA